MSATLRTGLLILLAAAAILLQSSLFVVKEGRKALITQFGSLESIYENLDQITGKARETLENSREVAFLSKTLASIDVNVPVCVPAGSRTGPVLSASVPESSTSTCAGSQEKGASFPS